MLRLCNLFEQMLDQMISMGPFRWQPSVWYCDVVSHLKHLKAALMPTGQGAGRRGRPKLLPADSCPNDRSPQQKLPWQAQAEERREHFIGNNSCGGPTGRAVQLLEMNLHLQRESQKALLSP